MLCSCCCLFSTDYTHDSSCCCCCCRLVDGWMAGGCNIITIRRKRRIIFSTSEKSDGRRSTRPLVDQVMSTSTRGHVTCTRRPSLCVRWWWFISHRRITAKLELVAISYGSLFPLPPSPTHVVVVIIIGYLFFHLYQSMAAAAARVPYEIRYTDHSNEQRATAHRKIKGSPACCTSVRQ